MMSYAGRMNTGDFGLSGPRLKREAVTSTGILNSSATLY